jgi:hypothetical protein
MMCKISKINTAKTETVNFINSIQFRLRKMANAIKVQSHNVIKNQYDSYLSRAGMRQVVRCRI